MRILHLSWEYPPVVYGGLGQHVHALAEAQAAQGHEVVVLTQAADVDPPGVDPAAAGEYEVHGVRVLRVERDAPFVPLDVQHLIGWILGFNSALGRSCVSLFHGWRPEVVHGHDWLVAHALALASQAASAPAVLTIHATEAGRHQGWMPSDLSRTIHGVEWWATHQAGAVIACSQHMRSEIAALFDVPNEHVSVIPNGVDAAAWRVPARARARVREQFPGPLIVYTGRLEWEKGVHTLIEAMPAIRRARRDAHLVIAGRGSAREELISLARAKRLGRAVSFEGWLPPEHLHALVAAADVAVVPSIYEPFGIVALEAAAAGTPVVAANSGGLAEVVEAGRTGWLFEPGSPSGLGSCILAALSDPDEARRRARAGSRKVTRSYAWPRIARLTDEVYQDVIDGRRPLDPQLAKATYGSGPALHVNLFREASAGADTRQPVE